MVLILTDYLVPDIFSRNDFESLTEVSGKRVVYWAPFYESLGIAASGV